MGASNVTQNVRQGLSNNESLPLASLSAKGKKIFTLKDVQIELNCSYGSAKDLTKSLVKKKWIINRSLLDSPIRRRDRINLYRT